MNYASFANHLPQVLHFALAFILNFWFWPRLIFGSSEETAADSFVANFIRMTFVVIITGYLTIVLKVFEIIALLIVYGFMFYRGYLRRSGFTSAQDVIDDLNLIVYDTLDGLIHPLRTTKLYFARLYKRIRVWRGQHQGRLNFWLSLGLFVLIFGTSAYLRFYDAFINAAPPLSDSYTTLAWMKDMGRRVLFYNGAGGEVYPRGFSIYLEVLHKFAFIDGLYILKYAGPLNSLLIVGGLYFTVSRLTGKVNSGLAAAGCYGLMAPFMHMAWERQASTNSQEFALVFLIPALFYLYRYLKLNEQRDFWTGAAGLSVVGLVHSLVFAYAGMSLGVLIILALAVNAGEYWRRCLKLAVLGIAAVLIALFPLGIGYLTGVSYHSSSVEFAVQQIAGAAYPLLNPLDYVALVGLVLIFVHGICHRKRELSMEFYLFFLGIITFLAYYAGGPVTKSLLIATRMVEFWALIAALIVGYSWYIISQWIEKSPLRRFPQTAVLLGLTLVIIFGLKPPSSTPYKMEWNSGVEQYLRISDMFRPKAWMIVSQEEGYGLVLGSGRHLLLRNFLDQYQPGTLVKDRNVPDNIFLYMEKRVFEVDKSNNIYSIEKPIYERRAREYTDLAKWVEQYRAKYHNIQVFYEDRNLKIFYIKKPKRQGEDFNKIWGADG